MTVGVRLMAVNDADQATVTVSPAVVSNSKLSADGILDDRRSRVLRTTSTADQVINLTWSADVLFTGVVIGRHNLSEDGTIRVQIYSDAAMTTEVYDSGAVDALYPVTLGALDFGVDPLGEAVKEFDFNNTPIWTTATTGRGLKITLSDGSNADGYLQVGRVFAGRYIEPTVNMDLGYILSYVDKAKQYRTEGGSLHAEPGVAYRRIRFRLSWLDDSERERFYRDFSRVGRGRQVYISLFPTLESSKELDHQMIAKIVNDPGYAGSRQLFSDVTYEFEEA